jgi:hypothetical protein
LVTLGLWLEKNFKTIIHLMQMYDYL